MKRKEKLKTQLIFSKFLNIQPSELENLSILDIPEMLEIAKEQGFFKPTISF